MFSSQHDITKTLSYSFFTFLVNQIVEYQKQVFYICTAVLWISLPGYVPSCAFLHNIKFTFSPHRLQISAYLEQRSQRGYDFFFFFFISLPSIYRYFQNEVKQNSKLGLSDQNFYFKLFNLPHKLFCFNKVLMEILCNPVNLR